MAALQYCNIFMSTFMNQRLADTRNEYVIHWPFLLNNYLYSVHFLPRYSAKYKYTIWPVIKLEHNKDRIRYSQLITWMTYEVLHRYNTNMQNITNFNVTCHIQMSHLRGNKQTREEIKSQCLKKRSKMVYNYKKRCSLQHKVIFMTQQKWWNNKAG